MQHTSIPSSAIPAAGGRFAGAGTPPWFNHAPASSTRVIAQSDETSYGRLTCW